MTTVINVPTKAERLQRMAQDPVIFAKEVETDFDPRPCQADLLNWIAHNDSNRSVGVTRKQRQVGASTSLLHSIAHSMWAKNDGWKCYIIAPNEDIAKQDFEPIYQIFEDTKLLNPYLKGCKKDNTLFRLGYKKNAVQVLLIGSKPESKRGIRFNNSVGGVLLFEEIDEIENARKVLSTYRPAASWSALTFFISTPRGFSGCFYDTFQHVKREQNKGNERYKVFDFPLRQFLAIRENDYKGIGIDFLREMKKHEPHHVYTREYLGQFCEEGEGLWFANDVVTPSWQTYQRENITHDPTKTLLLGIDFGTFDRSVLTYAQDNVIEDRLEVIDILTYREKKYCKDGDTPIHNLEDLIKIICTLRDRGTYCPDYLYVDKNNRGGPIADKLENDHGFNSLVSSKI